MNKYKYYIIYKPFEVLSQFTSEDGKRCLADLFKVPKNVYPVGRLDYDSEGLLILTNDTQLNHRLLHPSFAHERTYWVQVDGAINELALQELQQGVNITVNGQPYKTKPAKASILDSNELLIPERNPPIRFRKNVPAPWIQLTLTEGKNRQVRKMTAKVGFATLRLIRQKIGLLDLGNMQPGDCKELSQKLVYQKLWLQ